MMRNVERVIALRYACLDDCIRGSLDQNVPVKSGSDCSSCEYEDEGAAVLLISCGDGGRLNGEL